MWYLVTPYGAYTLDLKTGVGQLTVGSNPTPSASRSEWACMTWCWPTPGPGPWPAVGSPHEGLDDVAGVLPLLGVCQLGVPGGQDLRVMAGGPLVINRAGEIQ